LPRNPDVVVGTKVAVDTGPRERIGVVTRIDGDHVTVCLDHADWNEQPEVFVRCENVRPLKGWV
jgi:hypothetical protein